MKKFTYIAILVLVVLFASSCVTTEVEDSTWYRGAGMMPVGNIVVNNDTLQTDLFEVLGTATGSASVIIDKYTNYKDNAYGSLSAEQLEYLGKVRTVSQDPFALALAAAVNEMNKNAVAMGASCVVLPNYFIENDNGVLTVTVNATGIKLTEGTHTPNASSSENALKIKIE